MQEPNVQCIFNFFAGGSSPQGSYGQLMPPRSATSGLPPHLPPLLQQTILNQEPPSLVQCLSQSLSLSSPILCCCAVCSTVDDRQCGPPGAHSNIVLSSLQEDPSLLLEPNHVILNHLYALSIKVSGIILFVNVSLCGTGTKLGYQKL